MGEEENKQVIPFSAHTALQAVELLHQASAEQFTRTVEIAESQEKTELSIVKLRQQLRTLSRRLRKLSLEHIDLGAKV